MNVVRAVDQDTFIYGIPLKNTGCFRFYSRFLLLSLESNTYVERVEENGNLCQKKRVSVKSFNTNPACRT